MRSSPFGAALTATCVGNFVAVAAAVAWDALARSFLVFACLVRTLSCDLI